MKLPFWKMNGAGNDFVCVDNRRGTLRLTKKLVARLCHRTGGIGADGLLAIEKSPVAGADFRMRYFNADGGEADMCGNGARCFAMFLRLKAGWRKPVVRFLTGAGIVQGEFVGREVRVQLTPPGAPDLNRPVTVEGREITVHSINTGVPHAVTYVADADSVAVFELGRKLRFHEVFQPKGTNVNFVEVKGRNHIRVRTYERGVEGETLACGTGVTACALVSHLVHGFTSPVRVRVQNGDILKVSFNKTADGFADVRLQGPAVVNFEGTIHV
jgi:diaminopimelate epimerase